MKNVKRIIIAIILLLMLGMGVVVPIAYIGTLVFILGLYLINQNKKGKTTFKKPAWVVSAGLILFLILGMTFNEPKETTDKIEDNSVTSTTAKNESIKKEEDAEKAKKAEAKAKAEAEEIEKAEAKAEAERIEKEKAEAKAEAERIEKEKAEAKAEAERIEKEKAEAKAEAERIEKEKQELAQKEKEEQASTTTIAPSTTTTESYQNCTEMRKVYSDGVPSDHPAYASKHDRDKDNWACER